MFRRERTTEALQTRTRRWKKEQIFALIVACMPLLGFIIFNGFPLIISFIGMFCNVDLYDLTNIQWNNFEGFKSVFIPRHAYDLFYFDRVSNMTEDTVHGLICHRGLIQRV